MFIPIFIAILMGLISPTTNNANCKSGTVYVSNNEPNDDPGDPGDGGDEEEDPGTDGPGGTGTGGGTGPLPPPKP